MKRHPSIQAALRPAHVAQIVAKTGEVLTYGELEDRSNRAAHLFRSLGLNVGDGIAFWLDNNPRFLELCWAAQRSGLYYTPMSWYLTGAEASYVVRDCGANVLIVASQFVDRLERVLEENADLKVLVLDPDRQSPGHYPFDAREFPTEHIADESPGVDMLYTSGTTGRPKGVRIPVTWEDIAEPPGSYAFHEGIGFSGDMVYLGLGPLYHASPIHTTMAAQAFGATVILIDRFDAEETLALIEKYRVTHSNWVPTHFVRLLKLDESTRTKYDVSSLQQVLHGAGPCPIEVKRQLIDWLGPIVLEYYGGSEGFGGTLISSVEWLAHPGSVGRPTRSPVHVLDLNTFHEVPAGEDGGIYFESPRAMSYHNDPDKLAEAMSPQGWATFGDIGHVDQDGFVYLTDRKNHLIISGGVNVYPQEVENRLIMHPAVSDAAVFGIPNSELGEEVKAVVQLARPSEAAEKVAQELLRFCRQELAGFKCPRSIDFIEVMPRHENGKLYKRLLRDPYWEGRGSSLV